MKAFVSGHPDLGLTKEEMARLMTYEEDVARVLGKEPVPINPNHYTRFPIQPLEYIVKNRLDFVQGNTIKYVTRAGHKLYPGHSAEESYVIDLQKAKTTLSEALKIMGAE